MKIISKPPSHHLVRLQRKLKLTENIKIYKFISFYYIFQYSIVVYVLLTLHPCTILQINPTRCTILLSIFISLLYMFWATMCPSSGELTVSMRHWYVSLCMGGVWSAGWNFTPTSRPDTTHTKWQIPESHRYSKFSWWWAYSCPKKVGKRNKYAKENCAPIVVK